MLFIIHHVKVRSTPFFSFLYLYRKGLPVTADSLPSAHLPPLLLAYFFEARYDFCPPSTYGFDSVVTFRIFHADKRRISEWLFRA